MVVGALPYTLWGQGGPCETLHPLLGSSYQYKNRGNRCEGLYVADVGVNTLELISFELGSMGEQFKPGQRLQVSVRPPAQFRAI